mgnify:CR=1 FL=1
MMKNNILLLLLLICGLFACKDDETFFDVSIPRENIRFKPIPGGAVMYYSLPEFTDIFAVRAEYNDYKGKKMVKIASYAYDSLVLDGFNEARNEVPVRISLLNQSNEASKSVEMTFNTENSGPVAFFENIEVLPYWDGFQVKYDVPGAATGLCNVFFIGMNPMTQELDTLLVETFAIESGKNVKYFPLAQRRESNTVVLKTEDFRGNVAMQKIYEGIASYNVERLDPSEFEWIDPFHLSQENDNNGSMLGWKYLFDGDVKGVRKLKFQESYGQNPPANMYTFIAGPFAVNTVESPKYFILDIKESKQVSSIRMYAMLNLNLMTKPYVFNYFYGNKLPNWVTIYASNDKDDPDSWVEVGNFYQSPTAAVPWIQKAGDIDPNSRVKTMEELEAADPCYLTVNFSEKNPSYRYFKIEFNGVFKDKDSYWKNPTEYVTLHEVEVYGK